jgi:hypothetical protein
LSGFTKGDSLSRLQSTYSKCKTLKKETMVCCFREEGFFSEEIGVGTSRLIIISKGFLTSLLTEAVPGLDATFSFLTGELALIGELVCFLIVCLIGLLTFELPAFFVGDWFPSMFLPHTRSTNC